MSVKNRKKGSFLYGFFSLKKRILIAFVSFLFFCFTCIGIISGYAITSMMTNKIQAGIRSNLNQVRLSLENNLSNLSSVALQLSDMGVIGKEMGQFLFSQRPYERSQLLRSMKEEIDSISYINPNVGLIMYYFKNSRTTMLENSAVKDDDELTKLPLLASYSGVSYYGPHQSKSRFSDQEVLSVLMKVNLPTEDDVYAYVETGFKLTQNILDKDQSGVKAFHIIMDNNGRIAYSEIPTKFPINTVFQKAEGKGDSGIEKGFYWFKSKSNQGWSVISTVSKASYNKEKNTWFHQMFLLSAAFVLLLAVISALLLRIINTALHKFDRELEWIENGDFSTNLKLTGMSEFDSTLEKFFTMKKQVLNLIDEVKKKEKLRADLEIEKLRYQINPHFLMNTLHSVHWLAVMNKQDEIDRVVLSLNKLLQYNLGKTSKSATLGEEIDAMKEYMNLQQARYNFSYDIQMDSDSSILGIVMPRFILQPLVENALNHGLKDGGYIHIDIVSGEQVMITIHDNGIGMTEEMILDLMNQDQLQQGQGSSNMGIGLNYVKRMLNSYFGGKAGFEIRSIPGKGTTVMLSLPYRGVIS